MTRRDILKSTRAPKNILQFAHTHFYSQNASEPVKHWVQTFCFTFSDCAFGDVQPYVASISQQTCIRENSFWLDEPMELNLCLDVMLFALE